MKKLLLLLLIGLTLGLSAYFAWGELQVKVSALLTPVDSEPVPTMLATSRPYQLVVPANGELLGFQTIPVHAPRLRRGSLKVSWLAPEGTVVDEGSVLVEFDPSEARMQLEQSDNELTTYDYRIEKTEGDSDGEMTVLNKDRMAAEEEFEYATGQIRKDEDIFSRWEIQESIMSASLAEFREETIGQKIDLRGQLTESDLRILEIDQREARNEKEMAKETLASLSLPAPASGVVIYIPRGLERLEVGSQVWPGQPLLEIASLDKFRARLQVLEKEIAGVNPGLPVRVLLDSFPDRAFQARVSQVARVAKQIHREDPRKFFECDVLLDVEAEFLEQLKPGMSVKAEIELDQYSSAIVLPRSAVIKEDDTWAVFVVRGQAYARRPVEVLGSDHGFYLVAGLNEEETVCLRHPFEKEKLILPDFSAPTASTRRERFVIYR